MEKSSGERLGRVVPGVEAEGWRFIAFVRLVPLFPFNLLNYALGLTRIGKTDKRSAKLLRYCEMPGSSG